MMKQTIPLSPAAVFVLFNLFATLAIIAIICKEKFPDTAGLPLTYEQSFRKWFHRFSSQKPAHDISTPQITQDELNREKQWQVAGLVNVKDVNNSIVVDLKYSTTDNFLLTDVYGNLNACYLLEEAAKKLSHAQETLHKKYPFYNLVVFDGVRPLSVQKIMWECLKMPAGEKIKFLASPRTKSLHNFGAAADVSIVNSNGWEMDMGTPYDYFGELGYPSAENKMLAKGKLTHRQMENRKLLREVMIQAGFIPITTEWWHFNFCTGAEAARKYLLVE